MLSTFTLLPLARSGFIFSRAKLVKALRKENIKPEKKHKFACYKLIKKIMVLQLLLLINISIALAEPKNQEDKQEIKKVEMSKKIKQRLDDKLAACEPPNDSELRFTEKCLMTLRLEDYVQESDAVTLFFVETLCRPFEAFQYRG